MTKQSQKMEGKSNGIIKIYNKFYSNLLKSYLVATGTNTKVNEDEKLQKRIQEVINYLYSRKYFYGTGLKYAGLLA